jgi:predicted P-loop ATPase/5S rRNA maturation endonuclease (ribonuclease M5)
MKFSAEETRTYFATILPSVSLNGVGVVRCPCPIHHGDGNNFAIQIDTGAVYCHSQCQAGGDLAWIEEKLNGVGRKEALARVLKIVGRETKRVIAVYDYTDLDGTVLSQVVRYEPKSFKQRRNQRDWSVKGVKPVPYRLKEMLNGEKDVLIVEGEKSVDFLRGMGFNATTNAGGANKFSTVLTKYFDGKRVTIIGDNDTAGKHHAQLVKRLLAGSRILALNEMEDKWGADDYVAQYGASVLREAITRLWRVDGVGVADTYPAMGVDDDWKEKLSINNYGEPRRIFANVRTVLENDPLYKGAFGLNEMSGNIDVLRDVWNENIRKDSIVKGMSLKPIHDLLITCDLQLRLNFENNDADISKALPIIADQNKYNPLRDKLDKLVWDGVERINGWLSRWMLVDDNELSRAFGRLWLIQAVARIYDPGCKADGVLIISGWQGIGKSTVFQLLAETFGPYHTDTIQSFNNYRDAVAIMSGYWIIELSELTAMLRADAEKTKSIISQRADTIRQLYFNNRYNTYHRHFVFAGTTNESLLFTDDENRRFWPVKSRFEQGQFFDKLGFTTAVSQLWAEAVHAFKAGAFWSLPENLTKFASSNASTFQSANSWDDPVEQFCSGKNEVKMSDILTRLDLKLSDLDDKKDAAIQRRIAKILKYLAYEPTRIFKDGKQLRLWIKKIPPPST